MWADDLAVLLAKPTDAPGLKGRNPKQLATEILHHALHPSSGQSASFEPPIKIVEVNGPRQLYRIYDENRSPAWGDWWVDSGVVRQAWIVASRSKNFDVYDRQAFTLRLLRSAMCLHPGWTLYNDIARLDLAHGRGVPAITGRSSPRALAMNPSEVEHVLGQVYLPGEVQYFIPRDFIKPILVQRVQRSSPGWPFS